MMAGPDQLFQSYSTVHNNVHPKKHFHQKGSPNSFCKIKSILFSKKVKPILRLTITVPNLYVLKSGIRTDSRKFQFRSIV